MNWNVTRLAEVEATPWRNGGGVTRELALGPTSEAWDWRMSVADVAADGAFSRFDGVTRWFAVLHGSGIALTIPPTSADDAHCRSDVHRLTRHDQPLSFDRGALTQCKVLNGPTQDFNLMVRNPRCARMARVTGAAHELVLPNRLMAIYTVDSMASVRFDAEQLQVPPATLAWRRVTKVTVLHVQADHALWMELSP
jgi:uncharacterized protein